MPISPTGSDLKRRVRLKQSGGPDLVGELVEIMAADQSRDYPFAMVRYSGDKFPVATDLKRLDWADEQLI